MTYNNLTPFLCDHVNSRKAQSQDTDPAHITVYPRPKHLTRLYSQSRHIVREKLRQKKIKQPAYSEQQMVLAHIMKGKTGCAH